VGEVYPEYWITQVKEKWGGLRIYLGYPMLDPDNHGLSRRCEAILADIEARSRLTCEHCGQPGVRRETGWIKTLCDACSGGAPASTLRSVRNGNVTWHRFEAQSE
jgi:hypothetical protein